MILYLDASALVKRYVAELGTTEVVQAIDHADLVGTSIISRAETVAALAKAVRVSTLGREQASLAVQVFRSEWPKMIRVQVTETLIARADTLAWELGLRGYDAVNLASALLWHEGMNRQVVLATFDRQLWRATKMSGLAPFPDDLDRVTAR